jgi:phage shock protein C
MYRLRKVGKKERKLLGVCGGISKYLDPEMDPAIVRIIWVLLTIFSVMPCMILFYFILALVLKTEEQQIIVKEEPVKTKFEDFK